MFDTSQKFSIGKPEHEGREVYLMANFRAMAEVEDRSYVAMFLCSVAMMGVYISAVARIYHR